MFQTHSAFTLAEAGARAGLHQGPAVRVGGLAAAARVIADDGAAARPGAGAHLPAGRDARRAAAAHVGRPERGHRAPQHGKQVNQQQAMIA